MEICLSVDLSSQEGSLAIHRGTTSLHETNLGGSLRHTEAFLPTLEKALEETRLTLPQIDVYLTTVGPGSFTGLRIALASLKAMAFAQHKPIETFRNSEIRLLEAVARKKFAGKSAQVLTQVSANRIAIASFRKSGQGWELVEEETLDLPAPAKKSEFVVDDNFRLEAAWLAKFRLHAKSRQVHRSEKEWIDLSPLYFGSRF